MTKVLVSFIQDRSGSMQSCWQEAVGGFKAFIEELRGKKDDVEYLFSFTAFDTEIDTPYVATPLADVNTAKILEFPPRGMTALHDAVGTTVSAIEKSSHGADKVVVVVVTDGAENSSREWTKEKVHTLVDEKIKLGNWTFTYLGTQPETWAEAGNVGIPMANAAVYDANNSKATYAAMACSVGMLSRSAERSSVDFMKQYVGDKVAASVGMKTAPPQPKQDKEPPKSSSRVWPRN